VEAAHGTRDPATHLTTVIGPGARWPTSITDVVFAPQTLAAGICDRDSIENAHGIGSRQIISYTALSSPGTAAKIGSPATAAGPPNSLSSVKRRRIALRCQGPSNPPSAAPAHRARPCPTRSPYDLGHARSRARVHPTSARDDEAAHMLREMAGGKPEFRVSAMRRANHGIFGIEAGKRGCDQISFPFSLFLPSSPVLVSRLRPRTHFFIRSAPVVLPAYSRIVRCDASPLAAPRDCSYLGRDPINALLHPAERCADGNR